MSHLQRAAKSVTMHRQSMMKAVAHAPMGHRGFSTMPKILRERFSAVTDFQRQYPVVACA